MLTMYFYEQRLLCAFQLVTEKQQIYHASNFVISYGQTVSGDYLNTFASDNKYHVFQTQTYSYYGNQIQVFAGNYIFNVSDITGKNLKYMTITVEGYKQNKTYSSSTTYVLAWFYLDDTSPPLETLDYVEESKSLTISNVYNYVKNNTISISLIAESDKQEILLYIDFIEIAITWEESVGSYYVLIQHNAPCPINVFVDDAGYTLLNPNTLCNITFHDLSNHKISVDQNVMQKFFVFTCENNSIEVSSSDNGKVYSFNYVLTKVPEIYMETEQTLLMLKRYSTSTFQLTVYAFNYTGNVRFVAELLPPNVNVTFNPSEINIINGSKNNIEVKFSLGNVSKGYYTSTLEGKYLDGGFTIVLQLYVDINTIVPSVNFYYTPTNPIAGLTTITFTSNSTDNGGSPITSYEWDFGDGSKGSGMIVLHKYETSGLFTVKLTVTNAEGYSSFITKKIFVNENQIVQQDLLTTIINFVKEHFIMILLFVLLILVIFWK
jgi:hypothetical protein